MSDATATRRLFVFLGLLFAFAIRFSVILFSSDSFRDDPDAYRSLAVGLATTGTFGNSTDTPTKPTAFRPPLYPSVLSLGVETDSRPVHFLYLALLHSILGLATCFGASLLFHELTKARFPGIHSSSRSIGTVLTFILVAFDPILIRQSQLIMTETLATCLTVAVLICINALVTKANSPTTTRASDLMAVLTGLLFGLNALCRPSAFVWIGCLCVGRILLFRQWPISRSSLRIGIGLLVGVAICVVPWGIRNSLYVGKFLLTTSHGGYTLLLANNSSLYDHLDRSWSRDWDESTFFVSWHREASVSKNELDQDARAQELAVSTIWQRPLDFAESCLVREIWLWAPWPNQSNFAMQAAVGGWYCLEFLAALVGLWVLFRTPPREPSSIRRWLPLLSLIFSISLIHSVFWSNMRMRAVCMPAVAILASVGVAQSINRRKVGEEQAVCSA